MTATTLPGRADSHRPTARKTTLSLLCAGLCAAASVPAFAGPGLAGDSADTLPAATDSVTLNLVGGAVRIHEGDVLFASDVNQLIAAEAEAAKPVEEDEDGRVAMLLRRGLALLGTPYRWGGTSPDGGFDCSGLVGYVFRTALGIELPRISRDMARNGERVDRSQLTAGDLVFFSRRGKRVDHVGIYIGGGRFLHAPRTGRDVTVSELDDGYWGRRFLQARRIPDLGTGS